MKKVLLITFFFPPIPAAGTLRLGGLAKYLPEFGWEPTIITPTLPGEPDPRFKVIQTPYLDRIDSTQNKLSGANSKSKLLGSLISSNNFKNRPYVDKLINIAGEVLSYPDGKKGWKPVAVDIAKPVIENTSFDAMFSSSSPVTVHLIAHELKTLFGIPWMADLRDLWTQNPYYPYSRIRKSFERRLETKIFSKVDALSTTSRPWADDLQRLHNTKAVHVIHNGFDPDDVDSAPLTKEFTISYAGTLYGGKRDPSPLLQVLEELIDEGRINTEDVRVRFYGRTHDWLERKIKKHRLTDIVKQYGLIPRSDALNNQRESQLLLLLNWNDPIEVGTYTGKVYEYFAAKRPILSIGAPKGVVTDLLEETATGACANDVPGIKDIFMKYYSEYKESGEVSYQGKADRIDKYSHREMANKVANVLDSISE